MVTAENFSCDYGVKLLGRAFLVLLLEKLLIFKVYFDGMYFLRDSENRNS